jgi:hypothetical protein
MMYSSLLVSSLAVLAAASPVQLNKRAGGPVGQPIPDDCSITNSLVDASSDSTYRVSADFKNANQVYSFYLPMDSDNGDHDKELQTCLEQCYGYGNDGDCVGVYLAYNVPLPKDYPYGTAGSPSYGCQFFGKATEAGDFVKTANNSRYTDGQARNIACPSN